MNLSIQPDLAVDLAESGTGLSRPMKLVNVRLQAAVGCESFPAIGASPVLDDPVGDAKMGDDLTSK